MLELIFIFTLSVRFLFSLLWLALLLEVSLSQNVQAFDLSGSLPGSSPIEIESQQGITCEDRGRVCTARGDVVATRGASILTTDVLKATFSLNDQGTPSDLMRLEARGNARFATKDQSKKGQAQRIVYEASTDHTRLTGGALKLYADGLTVTADRAIDYYAARGEAVASGKAQAWKGDQLITAETLTAFFKKDSTGKIVLDHVVAEGAVVITTPQNTAQGQRAIYRVKEETARLTGDVRLTRLEGHMEGDCAEVNLKTGQGRMLSASGSSAKGAPSRVKVLLRGKNPTKP